MTEFLTTVVVGVTLFSDPNEKRRKREAIAMEVIQPIISWESGARNGDGKIINMSDENGLFWSRFLQEAVASSASAATLLRNHKGQGGIAKAPKGTKTLKEFPRSPKAPKGAGAGGGGGQKPAKAPKGTSGGGGGGQ